MKKLIKESLINESVEPIVTLRKYGEFGDLCFELLKEKHDLGKNVYENKEEIWKFIEQKLEEYETRRQNNTGFHIPDGAVM
jgi:hypothetical protein